MSNDNDRYDLSISGETADRLAVDVLNFHLEWGEDLMDKDERKAFKKVLEWFGEQ